MTELIRSKDEVEQWVLIDNVFVVWVIRIDGRIENQVIFFLAIFHKRMYR